MGEQDQAPWWEPGEAAGASAARAWAFPVGSRGTGTLPYLGVPIPSVDPPLDSFRPWEAVLGLHGAWTPGAGVRVSLLTCGNHAGSSTPDLPHAKIPLFFHP